MIGALVVVTSSLWTSMPGIAADSVTGALVVVTSSPWTSMLGSAADSVTGALVKVTRHVIFKVKFFP